MSEARKIGKYELTKLLGKGGMGEVWLSQDPDLAIPVAIKLLYQRLTITDPTYVQRFMMEAAHVARINHPNVVRIFSAGREGDDRYMVMEYLPGGSAKDILREMPDPELQVRCRRVIRDVALGLTAAAKADIVHRDVKPANILFDAEGVAKLADLGIGKAADACEDSQLTMTGNVVGTPFYIAPEQATDAKRVDLRSDLYALGATWYHLATGQVPFSGETSVSIMLKHVQAERPDPRAHNPHVSEADARMIRKLMALEPADRYQTPEELLADMELAERGELAPAPGTSSFGGWVGVLAALVLLALAAMYWPRGAPAGDGAATNIPVAEPAVEPEAPRIELAAEPELVERDDSEVVPEPAAVEPIVATGIRWVEVAAGAFVMGSNDPIDNNQGPAAAPPHSVTVGRDFAMSAHAVTKAQFAGFCEATGYETTAEQRGRAEHYGAGGWRTVTGASWRTAASAPDHPVVDVSWHDAVAYCDWLTRRDRERGDLSAELAYRLPTEAEWEYACRAGTTTPYSFGETAAAFAEFANCRDAASGLGDGSLWFERTAPGDDGFAALAPVGSYKPNAWGLYDMHGNVWEWCLDGPRSYQSRSEVDPRGEPQAGERVFRGGSWDAGVNEMRAGYRYSASPERVANNLGFRIVRVGR